MTKSSRTRVYVNYSETFTGGGKLPGEEGPFASREDRHIDFQVKNVSLSPAHPYHVYNYIEIPDPAPKHCYVVVVRYKSGDTFGNSYGNGCIEGVFIHQADAEKRQAELKNGKGRSIHGYKAWEGYFERLESVDIHLVPLVESAEG